MASENGQENRETLADIVAEIRAYGAQPPPRLMWLEIADRIEAAWKREAAEIEVNAAPLPAVLLTTKAKIVNGGNAAAMREALITIRQQLQTLDEYGNIAKEAYLTILGWIDAALSAPARQCDVGTADEKYQRWVHFCEQRLHSCHNCECKSPVGCTFKFGDMPYAAEEGGAS